MKREEEKRVGLVIGFGLDFYREILCGIKSFAETRPKWLFTPLAPEPKGLRGIGSIRFDGLIAHIYTQALGDALAVYDVPTVNVSGVLFDLPFPRVSVDHFEVGKAAAEHLIDRGLRRFAFVGYSDREFSIGRERGFRATIEAAGMTVERRLERDPNRLDPTGSWRWSEELVGFLAGLSRPVGVFACHDPQGVRISEACRQAGLRVPEDVAIVGVDNDDLLCELARPSLSSVALPAEKIGFEAAKLLDRLMAQPKRKTVPKPILLAPLGVVARGSSDVLTIEDQDVAEAIRFIRRNADQRIQVGDVLSAVPVSRRSLERRFKSILGRGIWEEIRRVHMERAKTLLAGGDRPMTEIAALAGFGDAKQLSVVFRQELDLTPGEYRRRFRSRP